MKVNALQDEIEASRQYRKINLAVLLLFLLLGALNFSLIHATLPVLTSIGPQGISGVEGMPGLSVVGVKGDSGIQGIQGVAGEPGAQGQTGAVGATGVQGEPGIQGEQGSVGDSGVPAKIREQRCVQNNLNPREEYRYEGDFSWLVDYYLPLGSMCP